MIVRFSILIALVLCLSNCRHTQGEREKEIEVLFKAIHEYEVIHNIDSTIPISDRFGRFMSENFWNVIDDTKEDKFVLYYDNEHMKYIELQYESLRKDSINHWSETSITTIKPLVAIDLFKKHDLFEKQWWDEYTQRYGHKAIRLYSYPLFNITHTEAYFVFGCYNAERHKTFPPETYIYMKNEKGEWEYSSRDPM